MAGQHQQNGKPCSQPRNIIQYLHAISSGKAVIDESVFEPMFYDYSLKQGASCASRCAEGNVRMAPFADRHDP
jgi:hypothetical protein